MSKLLIQILFFSFFKRIHCFNVLYRRKVLELWLEHRLFLNIGSAKVVTFNSFRFQNVHLYGKGTKADTRNIRIRVQFWQFFKGKKLKEIIDIHIEAVVVSASGRSISVNDSSLSDSKSTNNIKEQLFQLENKYYPLLKGVLDNLFKLKSAIKISELAILKNDLTINVHSLTLENGNIDIQSQLQLRNQLDQDVNISGIVNYEQRAIDIVIRCVDNQPEINVNKYNFEECAIALSEYYGQDLKESTFHTSIELKNTFLNNRSICSEAILIKNLQFEMEAKCSRQHFIITDESAGVFEEISFSFSLSHDLIDNDLLKTIVLIELEPESLLNSIPSFYNEEIKTLICEGRLVLQISFMFNITNPFEYHFDVKALENTLDIVDSKGFDLSYLNYNNIKEENDTGFSSSSFGKLDLNEINGKFLDIVVLTYAYGIHHV